MIAVTLDVNVFGSGFPASREVPAALLERWLCREFELVVSEHILTEAAEAWDRPYWTARYTPDRVQQALALLRERATIVVPAEMVHGVAEDEEDDLVLAMAVAGNAAYLVTDDKKLREVGRYQGVTIITPREFLELLEQERDAET